MFTSFTGSFKAGRRAIVVAPAPAGGLVANFLTAPASGTTWNDASGNGRHATLMGSATYVSNNGGGIKLPNSSYTGTSYISVPYNISTNTATVEIVASFNPTSFWAVVWGNESYFADKGYLCYMGSSTNFTWGSPMNSVSSTITASNSIRHWTWVIDGTSKSLFLNGSQVGTTQTSNNPAGYTTNNFYFGSRHGNDGTGATDRLNSSISANQPVFYQMRIYDKALSSAEVLTSYNAIKSTYGI